MIVENPNKVRLCRAGSCCPVVEKNDENSFTISDDYNGKVKITRDEMKMLKEAIEHFEKE